MDEEEEPGVVSHFMEADQDPETNLALARQNVPKLLAKVLEHEETVQELEREHVAGKISSSAFERALDDHARLVRRLEAYEKLFSMHADELEKRLNLKD